MNNGRLQRFLPILLSLALVAGIWLGSKLAPPENQPIIFPSRTFNDVNKLNEILNYIDDSYVDSVSKSGLVHTSIENLLESLDPHSYYISADVFKAESDELEGNFEGIGIEFRIINDSIVVINTLPGGPSEKAGLLAGDRIVKVNDSLISGIGLSNSDVKARLKGEVGSSVKVAVKRRSVSDLIDFNLKRGKIPIKSVESAYMIDEETGFIQIDKFGSKTYEEFIEASEQLKENGLKHLIIDLRNNGGGYLKAATNIADEFLANKELIVYTEGRARMRRTITASSGGKLKETEVYILINQSSASASEILAGAIQDNDRGTIIGRRSFGKGLVQEQLELPDGSAVRLTVARYYTPTGRSIQKPYGDDLDAYRMESYQRYENGELQSADSIRLPDSLKYITKKGKVVYGGGGIMPDVFVPIDTSMRSNYLLELQYNGILQDFCFNYADRNRKALEKYENVMDFNASFDVNVELLNDLVEMAKKQGIEPAYHEILTKEAIIKNRLKATIARNIWGLSGYTFITNQLDTILKRAREIIAQKKGAE